MGPDGHAVLVAAWKTSDRRSWYLNFRYSVFLDYRDFRCETSFDVGRFLPQRDEATADGGEFAAPWGFGDVIGDSACVEISAGQ